MAAKTLKPGQHAPDSRVYDCTRCGTPNAMLTGEKAPQCDVCLETGRKQEWKPTHHEILLRVRNIKKEFEKRRTSAERAADAITGFCGSVRFLLFHALWFGLWVAYNSLAAAPFDPFPFGFLTLVVSLEAIVLATFILISQNRQGAIFDLRSELDYQVDVQAEKRTVEILAILHEIREKLKRRS